MKKLYKFDWGCYHGFVSGLIVETEEDVKNSIGKMVNFGEAEGKHSETRGILEERHFEVISINEEFIENFERAVGKSFGYNPLKYLEEDL